MAPKPSAPCPLAPKPSAPCPVLLQLRSSRIWLDQADAAGLSQDEEVTLMDWGNAIIRVRARVQPGVASMNTGWAHASHVGFATWVHAARRDTGWAHACTRALLRGCMLRAVSRGCRCRCRVLHAVSRVCRCRCRVRATCCVTHVGRLVSLYVCMWAAAASVHTPWAIGTGSGSPHLGGVVCWPAQLQALVALKV